jgi:hypothetical protein
MRSEPLLVDRVSRHHHPSIAISNRMTPNFGRCISFVLRSTRSSSPSMTAYHIRSVNIPYLSNLNTHIPIVHAWLTPPRRLHGTLDTCSSWTIMVYHDASPFAPEKRSFCLTRPMREL